MKDKQGSGFILHLFLGGIHPEPRQHPGPKQALQRATAIGDEWNDYTHVEAREIAPRNRMTAIATTGTIRAAHRIALSSAPDSG